jgi:hypothetical protein
VRNTHDITMPSIMSSIILGILISGKADFAEPDARTEPPTAMGVTTASGAEWTPEEVRAVLGGGAVHPAGLPAAQPVSRRRTHRSMPVS